MLVKLQEHLKIKNNLSRPHKGKVVLTDAAETQKLGRIKVRIRGIFEETDTDKLPWVYPQNPYGLGGKPDCSSFSVPEIDSEVTVEFLFDDIYAPFYTGYWQSDLTKQSPLFDTNYPNQFGFVSNSVTGGKIQWIRVDKQADTAEFYNENGECIIKLDSSGNLLLNVKTGIQLNLGGALNIKATSINLESVTGDINLKSAAKVNSLAATDVNIKASSDANIQATTDVNIKATANVNIDGALIQENSAVSGTAASASGATVTGATSAKTAADTLAGQVRDNANANSDDIGGF